MMILSHLCVNYSRWFINAYSLGFQGNSIIKKNIRTRSADVQTSNDLETQYEQSKGVYGSHGDVHYITKKEIQIISLTCKNKGVRRENVIYKIESNKKQKSNILEYSRPCVCGSTTHFSFKHVDCMLNDQYDDAIIT